MSYIRQTDLKSSSESRELYYFATTILTNVKDKDEPSDCQRFEHTTTQTGDEK